MQLDFQSSSHLFSAIYQHERKGGAQIFAYLRTRFCRNGEHASRRVLQRGQNMAGNFLLREKAAQRRAAFSGQQEGKHDYGTVTVTCAL
jgi:hypothetical protein